MNGKETTRSWKALMGLALRPTDIRYWILIFFFVRCIGLVYPPIEVHHNWRQTGTLMTVRAFSEKGVDLLRPETAIAGFDRSNILGSEFPLFNYLIYIATEIFGYDHWYGRLINLLFSSLGIWVFFCIVKRLTDPKRAFIASLILLASVWFMFSRKIMPDTFSYSLVLIGVEGLWRYAESGRRLVLLGGAIALVAGLLSKMPSLVGLVFLAPLAVDPMIPLSRRIAVTTAAGAGILIMAIWYFGWVPYLISEGGYQLYWPKTLSQGWAEIRERSGMTLYRVFFSGLYSYVTFAFFILGFFVVMRYRRHLALCFGAVILLWLVFLLKTGLAFPAQDYYMIPFVPWMAVLASEGIMQVSHSRLRLLLLAIAISEALLNQQHDLRWPVKNEYKLSQESTISRYAGPNEPIAFVSDLNPSDMYFSHRPGWLLDTVQVGDPVWHNRLRDNGCRWIAVNHRREWLRNFYPPLTLVAEDECWRIYRVPDK